MFFLYVVLQFTQNGRKINIIYPSIYLINLDETNSLAILRNRISHQLFDLMCRLQFFPYLPGMRRAQWYTMAKNQSICSAYSYFYFLC